LYKAPPLYRDVRGTCHSTPECAAVAAEFTRCSHEGFDAKRYERCERCVPVPIFVPKAGATDRRVYHADLQCRSLPRRLRFPVLQLEWVWWPSWDYNHVIHDREFVRCTACIPDRALLYPPRRKAGTHPSVLRSSRRRTRRRKAA